MNIVQLLIDDHDRLRRELVGIRRCLLDQDSRKLIKQFLEKLELHESIEDEILFPHLKDSIANDAWEQFLRDCEKAHVGIWAMVDKVIVTLDQGQSNRLKDEFFSFDAHAEAHFRYEEQILFPSILRLLSEESLELLGDRAERRMHRFSEV